MEFTNGEKFKKTFLVVDRLLGMPVWGSFGCIWTVTSLWMGSVGVCVWDGGGGVCRGVNLFLHLWPKSANHTVSSNEAMKQIPISSVDQTISWS